MSEPNPRSSSSWNRLKLGAGILTATLVIGVAGYVIAGWRLLDAVYMVVITVLVDAPGHGRPLCPGDQLLVLSRSDRTPDLAPALAARSKPHEISYRGARLRRSS